MNRRHRVSDGLFDAIYKSVTSGENWVAFNQRNRYLQRGDLLFFKTPAEARAFASANTEKNAAYAVTFAASVLSLYRELEGIQTINKPIQSSTNKSVMNEKNLAYLKEQLKYMGFGDKLYESLEKELGKGAPNFQLTLETEINKKAFAAVLNFRKSDNTDLYFFNSYHATLGRRDGEIRDQAFYLANGRGVTAKEAFNLLEGRAVYKEMENKEGQKYHAWVQLDFDKRDKNNNHEVKQFHDAYGYKLADALSRYPIRETGVPDQYENLLSSLQKGNLQAVTLEKPTGDVRIFVEANPRYKGLNLYDGELKRMPKEELAALRVPGNERANTSAPTKEKSEGPVVKEEKTKKQVNNKNEASLLPKKSQQPKKGLGLA